MHSKTIATALALAAMLITGCSNSSGGGNKNSELNKPTELTVLSAGDGTVSLQWKSVPRASGYHLYMASESFEQLDGDAANYATLANSNLIGASVTSATVTGLTNDRLMFFAVTATTNERESVLSDEVVAAAITPRTDKTLTLNGTGITISAAVDEPYGNYDHCQDVDGLIQDCQQSTHAVDLNRLDASGNEVTDPTAEWHCVLDNATGLIWEVKQMAGAQAATDHFNWYSTNALVNAGNSGVSNDDGAICSGYSEDDPATFCNTQAYIVRINNQGLCGLSNWRLPEVDELKNIVHYGKAAPMIADEYFPNTESGRYWTATANVLFGDNAWVVDFGSGRSGFVRKSSNHRVRLVSHGKQEIQP